MTEEVRDAIKKTIKFMLEKSVSDANIHKIVVRHQEKVHFVPLKYRVLGGVLQGLNIILGNFIEQLLINIVGIDSKVNTAPECGRKVNLFFYPSDGRYDRFLHYQPLIAEQS